MSTSNPLQSEGRSGVRLDIWLWAARFFKTRALAKQAIEAAKIVCNDSSAKPSRAVHVGDRLNISRGDERFEIVVLAIAERRGPASAAALLYHETETSLAARLAAAEQHRLTGPARPVGKPDKRARRLIRALGDIDAF